MAYKTFHRGSSVLTCRCCARKTRDVGNGDICAQCFDLAGIDNEISDGHATAAERAAEVSDLVADLQSKNVDVVAAWGDLIERCGLTLAVAR